MSIDQKRLRWSGSLEPAGACYAGSQVATIASKRMTDRLQIYLNPGIERGSTGRWTVIRLSLSKSIPVFLPRSRDMYLGRERNMSPFQPHVGDPAVCHHGSSPHKRTSAGNWIRESRDPWTTLALGRTLQPFDSCGMVLVVKEPAASKKTTGQAEGKAKHHLAPGTTGQRSTLLSINISSKVSPRRWPHGLVRLVNHSSSHFFFKTPFLSQFKHIKVVIVTDY